MKALQRLQRQAAQTHHGVARVNVTRSRMAFKIGPITMWVPGYTIVISIPGSLPIIVRTRTSKSCGDILRGISIGSLFGALTAKP